jgi:hypothetical protein
VIFRLPLLGDSACPVVVPRGRSPAREVVVVSGESRVERDLPTVKLRLEDLVTSVATELMGVTVSTLQAASTKFAGPVGA